MIVRVTLPDPAWASMYESEAQRLRVALNDIDVEVHHIGSTAIRGIVAKPIIDILLVVQDLDSLDARVEVMGMLGYEAKGEFGIPGRRYFRKTSYQGVRTHHIHAFVRGSAEVQRHLAFRDYMNSHAEVARAYGSLKQQLASTFPGNAQAYVAGKDSFVKQHEALALTWFSKKS